MIFKTVLLYEATIWITLGNIVFLLLIEKFRFTIKFMLPIPHRVELLLKLINKNIRFLVPDLGQRAKATEGFGNDWVDQESQGIENKTRTTVEYVDAVYSLAVFAFFIAYMTSLGALYPRWLALYPRWLVLHNFS